MKNIILISIVIMFAGFSMPSYSKMPAGPKPRCSMGQHAKLFNGSWRCVEPDIKAGGHQLRNRFKGPKPQCKMGQVNKFVKGYWRCVKLPTKPPVHTQRHQQGAAMHRAGKKPTCKMRQIAKMVNGSWKCVNPRIKVRRK